MGRVDRLGRALGRDKARGWQSLGPSDQPAVEECEKHSLAPSKLISQYLDQRYVVTRNKLLMGKTCEGMQ